MVSTSSTFDPAKMTTLELHGGAKMPQVGLGLWKLPKEVCADQVYNAIKTGYRMLDGACDYGNEKEVGQGIKKALDEGLCKREDLFVVSKLWNTFHRPEHVEPAIKRTLSDLGLEYLDLYIIHFPIHLKYVDPEVRYPPEWVYDPKAEKPVLEFEESVTYQ
jgi:D-xylose reductase